MRVHILRKFTRNILKNSINIEGELQRILSNEIANSIDAEIISNIMKIATNNVRKMSIRKIFKAKASE